MESDAVTPQNLARLQADCPVCQMTPDGSGTLCPEHKWIENVPKLMAAWKHVQRLYHLPD